MAIISGSSKRGQDLLIRASVNQGTTLRQVYSSWSDKKEKAMSDCLKECSEDGGTDFRIISHSRDNFSVAWEYINQETGEVMTKIKTHANTYIIDGSRVSRK